MPSLSKPGSFGARPCRRIRERLFEFGIESLPPGWRRSWIIARIRATPRWADFRKIREIYTEARRLTLASGHPHEVDHEIPLQHPLVCGLHNEFNLRPRTRAYNQAKKNTWHLEQQELPFGQDAS